MSLNSESATEQELLDELNELRSWAAGSRSKQSEKAHRERKNGNEKLAERHEGRRETYYNVEQILVEKVLPLAEEVAEDQR